MPSRRREVVELIVIAIAVGAALCGIVDIVWTVNGGGL